MLSVLNRYHFPHHKNTRTDSHVARFLDLIHFEFFQGVLIRPMTSRPAARDITLRIWQIFVFSQFADFVALLKNDPSSLGHEFP